MGLEVGTYISDLVATNPVGATDPKSQGDDHLRLLKATIKASFPAVAGAVAASHVELSILDGATLSTAELNILDGVTLTAAQINNAALLAASNVFTHAVNTWQSNSGPTFIWDDGNAATDERKWFLQNTQGTFQIGTLNDAGSAVESLLTADRTGGGIITAGLHADAITITGDSTVAITGTITLNSVNATDFARLSQANVFTDASQKITTAAGNPRWWLDDGTLTGSFQIDSTNDWLQLGTHGAYSLSFFTNNAHRFSINSSGNYDFKAGTVTTTGTTSSEVGYKGLPISSQINLGASYTLTAADNGKQVYIGGSTTGVTVPAGLPAGFCCMVFSNTGGNTTITQSSTSIYLAGVAGGSPGNRTMTDRAWVSISAFAADTYLVAGTAVS